MEAAKRAITAITFTKLTRSASQGKRTRHFADACTAYEPKALGGWLGAESGHAAMIQKQGPDKPFFVRGAVSVKPG